MPELLSLRQRHTDDFLVVPGVNGPVRERRMRPDDGAAGVAVAWVEQMRAADLLVFLRREPGDDEVTLFVEQEIAVAVFHNKRVAPALGFARGRLERFPKP